MKYKLKQWYPLLPKDWEVGMEVGQGDRGVNGTFSPCNAKYKDCYLYPEEIQNYPEFWEKVEEKEYEILEYQSLYQKGIISKSYYNTFVQMKSDFKIYSVKRLSDGEIFKLGDLVNYNKKSNYGNWKINNFIVKSGIILARSENNLICESIIDLKHIKIPILITEDGVELFEGDCFYFVDKWFGCWNGTVCDSNIRDKYKYFSTSEAAEKYLNENKPMYSKKEVIDFGGYILRNLKGVMPMKLLFELWLREKGN